MQRGYVDIEQGDLVDTYSRSAFEDTRRKAAKFGAMGSTIRATKANPTSGEMHRSAVDAREKRRALPGGVDEDDALAVGDQAGSSM